MPTKRLPGTAHIDHLKHQAKDLLRDVRAGDGRALQRVREFHPRLRGLSDGELQSRSFALSDAQLSIAREYGYASWPRMKTVLAERAGASPDLIHNYRIEDGPFKQALDFLDAGDVPRLAAHLRSHPDLIKERVRFEGENYFTQPTLLEFIAENPVRRGQLPGNIVEVAQVILDAGAAQNRDALNATLELAASGRVCREAGVQVPLLELLCAYGAEADTAMGTALAHGEFAAAEALIVKGANVDVPAAAALNRTSDLARMLPTATPADRQLGLSLAALHGHAGVVAQMLAAGADPNRYNPEGAHCHCTPLHSAALAGHSAAVRALVDGGARDDIRDVHHNATARMWAAHGGHEQIVRLLDETLPN